MKILIITLILVGIVLVLKIYFPEIFSVIEKKSRTLYSYKRKDFIMSRAEHKFFDILIEIVENKYYIFPQIHLATILNHKIVGQNWKGAFHHIDEKSVDYVVCDKEYLKPLIAIELDDRSHKQNDRIKRDIEVERILNEANFPFIRFENHGSFNKKEIKNLIFKNILLK